jgi:glyoxylase-like metal-dependent hydrolase (beta-lactamase superfamily II)/rhodanese-related sulfurtransferase
MRQTHHQTHAPDVVVVETPTLGDRSYLVHDGEIACVIDPQRDIDRVLSLLDGRGLRLTHVLETHIHNDYLTGGLALARYTGARYLLSADDVVCFERTPLRDGDVIAVGERIRLTALATPGHTFHHLSYVLTEGDTGMDEAVGVFTGGSLLHGATGRPDLLGAQHTTVLARHQHASAHRLASLLPDDAGVFPTHGFGSFCSANQPAPAGSPADDTPISDSTIGHERTVNPALAKDERAYVDEILAGLGAWPAYYAHMSPRNAAGPSAPDLSPPAVADVGELRRRIDAGEWVVDLRHRSAFAAGHAPGTLNFGLDGSFATYLGWLIAWGSPLTLLGEVPAQIEQAQRELVRIGIDRPVAAATGTPADWTGRALNSFPTATFTDLGRALLERDVVVLDVRRAEEFAACRIDEAVNIPIHLLSQHLDEVPDGEVWVHCAAGYRASIGASMLDAAGRRPVVVDDVFENAEKAGLPLVGSPAADPARTSIQSI